jgi:hypothetical protein
VLALSRIKRSSFGEEKGGRPSVSCHPARGVGRLIAFHAARQLPGDSVNHALNHATKRHKLFRKTADYAAFLQVLGQALL